MPSYTATSPHSSRVRYAATYTHTHSQLETGTVTIRTKVDFPQQEAGSATAAAATEADAAAGAGSESTAVSAEAVDALAAVSWDGDWRLKLTVTSVDGGDGADDMAQFKGSAPGAVRGKAAAAKSRVPTTKAELKVGSIIPVHWALTKKPGSYFRGTAGEVLPFGKEGSVTGSSQRTTGKVTIQMQVTSSTGVTTSFNMSGTFNPAGVLSGTFSACEISRTAMSIAGSFKLAKPSPGTADDAEAA